jgi:hypothetical protein
MSRWPSTRFFESSTRKASPVRRKSAQSLLAFIKDQILQFWPPYRHEETKSIDERNDQP